MVGNETGRSFEIDEKGEVLTPFEIERRTEVERLTQEVIEKNKSFEDGVKRLILKTMKEFGDSILRIEDDDRKTDEVEKLRKKYDGKMEKISSWYLRYLNRLIERGKKTKEELEVQSLEELEKELGFEIEPEKGIGPEIE